MLLAWWELDGTAATCSPSDTEMNQARAHLCLATHTSVFEGTAALLLSFVFPDLSGNFPDFSRAEPDVFQRGRVELGFVHTWRATRFGIQFLHAA